MQELRQFFGYTFGLGLVGAALTFSVSVIALEALDHAASQPAERNAPRELSSTAAAEPLRDANAQPVWIAATPKYQYDPKLMEVKPRNLLLQEAALRRKQEAAAMRAAKQREAKLRAGQVSSTARKAFASMQDQAPPFFFMFQPQ